MRAFLEYLASYPEGILLLAVALFNSGWVYYLVFFKQNFHQAIYKAYFFYAMAALIWVLSNAYFELGSLTSFGPEVAKNMALVANVAVVFAVLGFYCLSCLFKNSQRKILRKEWLFIALMASLILFFNLKPGLTVVEVKIFVDGNFELVFGKWNILFFLTGILMFIFGISNIILALRKNKTVNLEDKKLIYMLSGISIMFISTITFSIIFPGTANIYSLTWLPPALTSLEILLVGYAILTQRFPSLKLLLSGISKAIFVLLCSLAVGYFFGILLFGGLPEFYSVLIFCVISALGYHTLIKYLDLPVFYYLLGASNIKRFKAEIGKFRNKNTVYTDLAELNKDLRQTFRQKFFIEPAQIIILDRKTQKQYPAIRQHCQKEPSILVTKELELQENRQKQPGLVAELQALGELCLPLFSPEQRLIGFFVLGRKPFQKPYTKEEIEAVEATQCHFSTVLSSVLHSTKLQKQLEHKNKILELKNKAIQKQNAKMRKLLAQQQDFIHVAAHELRTPVTICNAAASVMPSSKKLGILQFGLDRLADRVSEIVYVYENHGQKMQPKFTKIKIQQFFQKVFKNFMPLLKKEKRQFSFDNKINEEIEAEFDQAKIYQVVENLLTNALKFTKENGIITFHLALDQEKLKFAVTDNGCGVPDDTKEEIFKRFRGNHSTKNKGLGLGLYICRRIIRLHKGKIWCEDAPLKSGTTFCVEIPLQQSLAPEKEAEAEGKARE